MKVDSSLTPENINQNLLNIQYAVRGPIPQRALQIEREIQKVGVSEIMFCFQDT